MNWKLLTLATMGLAFVACDNSEKTKQEQKFPDGSEKKVEQEVSSDGSVERKTEEKIPGSSSSVAEEQKDSRSLSESSNTDAVRVEKK